jgi:hypothetical protein
MGRRTGLSNKLPVLYWVYVRLLNQFSILTSTVPGMAGTKTRSLWLVGLPGSDVVVHGHFMLNSSFNFFLLPSGHPPNPCF